MAGLGNGPCVITWTMRKLPSSPYLSSAMFTPSKFDQALGFTQQASRRCSKARLPVIASVDQFSSDDFQVDRLLSTYGYMNVSSYGGPLSGSVMGMSGVDVLASDRRDLTKISGLQMGEGGVRTRIYSGKFVRGKRKGTRVLLKAYPYASRGSEVDIMAVNELVSHAALQDAAGGGHPNISYLFGGFQTRAGEQWLVFRDDGQTTAAEYAKAASEATSTGQAVGQWDFWDRFNPDRPLLRRKVFITELLQGVFRGLAFMHTNGRLHQSLGPTSVVLNLMDELDAGYLIPQLRDLAFAADMSMPDFQGLSMESATSALAAGLWRRAAASGAQTPFEKIAFGTADDIYAGGLLLAYMVFVPLCEPGSIDGPSLQRLFESTFRLDILAARDYCAADDRWDEAVKFMDLDDGAGWQLLQAMLNPNYRHRPTAQAVLSHRFLTGFVLE